MSRARLGIDPAVAHTVADLKRQNATLVHMMNDVLDLLNARSDDKFATLQQWLVRTERQQRIGDPDRRRGVLDVHRTRLLEYAEDPYSMDAARMAHAIMGAPRESWARPSRRDSHWVRPKTGAFPADLPANFAEWTATAWTAWYRYVMLDERRIRASMAALTAYDLNGADADATATVQPV